MCCADGRPGHRDGFHDFTAVPGVATFQAVSFSFEDDQVLEGEGSGLPPEGRMMFMASYGFFGVN